MPRILNLKEAPGKPGEVYYPLNIKEVPKPKPGQGEVLVRMAAAALNHRDLFIRHHLYPGIELAKPLLADGSGTVVEVGPGVSDLLGKKVVLTPMRGWESDPEGPDHFVAAIGSTNSIDAGAAQDYIVVPADEVVPAPEHLTAVQAAALPLAGLTAWRALVHKAGAAVRQPGRNVLITGIGGGVALLLLQFAVALGANAYVTSGSRDKIDAAVKMGAKGGVVYKDKDWDKQLRGLLPGDRPFLDAVLDGAGGDIVKRSLKLLKPGGTISVYGMTVAPKMDWLMSAVIANIDLRGSTMGSKREFREMVAFVDKHKIVPIVSRSVKGLDNLEAIDGLFAEMEGGKQFGKLVIEIGDEDAASKL